jgi:uncharacterized membrane protein HdeD (DUF308 family)
MKDNKTMSDNLTYNEDPKHAETLLRSQQMVLEAGTLGKFFGSPQRAASSIACITIFLLTCSGVVSMFFACNISTAEYWKIITPIITLALGYLFGRMNE